MTETPRPQRLSDQRQSAWIALRLKDGSLRMGVRVTPAGIWAVGGLMAAILLSTAVIVGAARARRLK
ncbi:hypothetical protein [Asticcacaulis sp. AND118]|uniref:hypothetical protein n=1 Tax=Asticcacaulis sp. AND118 TaxID=2840468 RepID=UPI001CFF9362|nr:hypothetical protein [Asticcacaulis sp. AND118]UDF04955.1 hypothetical protein LH365_16290 [Asticcacaulis sp. AND118]